MTFLAKHWWNVIHLLASVIKKQNWWSHTQTVSTSLMITCKRIIYKITGDILLCECWFHCLGEHSLLSVSYINQNCFNILHHYLQGSHSLFCARVMKTVTRGWSWDILAFAILTFDGKNSVAWIWKSSMIILKTSLLAQVCLYRLSFSSSACSLIYLYFTCPNVASTRWGAWLGQSWRLVLKAIPFEAWFFVLSAVFSWIYWLVWEWYNMVAAVTEY